MTVEASAATPAVSIIIPCYNYESYVAEAIESALAQTFDDFEVIVVDDGSTDRSAEVISRYAGQIQLIRKENGGVIKACQTGLGRSSGRFVMFLDADDVLEPTALAEVAPFLTDNTSKIQFKLQPIDAAGLNIGVQFPKSTFGFSAKVLREEIYRCGCYNTPPTSGNIYRRDVYTQLGAVDYDYGNDGVAYLLAPFIGDVVFIEKCLGRYRLHGNNMSGAGIMNPVRIQRDGEVFVKRLSHLVQLLGKNGIDAARIRPLGDYQYRFERLVQSHLVQGQKIPVQVRIAYLRSILRERRGIDRLMYMIFGVLSVFAPRKLALVLVKARNDPAAHPHLRTIFTRF